MTPVEPREQTLPYPYGPWDRAAYERRMYECYEYRPVSGPPCPLKVVDKPCTAGWSRPRIVCICEIYGKSVLRRYGSLWINNKGEYVYTAELAELHADLAPHGIEFTINAHPERFPDRGTLIALLRDLGSPVHRGEEPMTHTCCRGLGHR